MRRARIACALVVAILVVAGCGGTDREISNRFGDCTFVPKTNCPNQDLSAIAASNSDLDGSDFSGSNFTGADLRNVSFRGAKLVKTILNSHLDPRSASRYAKMHGLPFGTFLCASTGGSPQLPTRRSR